MRKFNGGKVSSCVICTVVVIVSLFFSYLLFSRPIYASGIFKSSSYSLPSGKDMLLWPSRTFCSGITWESKNNNVATVNSYGIVHAKSEGSTQISAFNHQNKTKSFCTINVTAPEPIRSVYMTPYMPVENESITLYALTPKNSNSVKFVVSSHNFRKEIHTQRKSINGDLYLWHANLLSLKSGNYKLEVFSNVNGAFKTSPNSTLPFKVSNPINKSTLSNQRRELSRDGADFIIRQEGFVPHVYRDIMDFLTIGYGKSVHPYEPFYNNLNKEEAYGDFLQKVNCSGFANSVNDLLAGNNIKFNQHQFDALVSFTYNIGKAWTRKSYLRSLILNSGKQNGSTFGTVNSSNGLFLRENASIQSKKLASLYYGEKVTILGKKNEKWYNVKTSKGMVGYCFSDYLNVDNYKVEGKNLNCIDRKEFIAEFLQYHHTADKCFKGLFSRRIKELEIFLTGNYNSIARYNAYPTPHCIRKIL